MSERSLTHSRSDILKNLIKAVLGVESYRMVKIKFNEGKYDSVEFELGFYIDSNRKNLIKLDTLLSLNSMKK